MNGGVSVGRRRASSSTSSSSPRVSPEGERIPPEGEEGEEEPAATPFVHRIQVRAEVNQDAPPPSPPSAKKMAEEQKKPKRKPKPASSSKKSEDISDLLEGGEDDDDFGHLRKLIREGRIAGLNEKPPSFVPPTPPTPAKAPTNAATPKSAASASAAAARRRSSSKPPAPNRPIVASGFPQKSGAAPAKQRSQSQTREFGAGGVEKRPSTSSAENNNNNRSSSSNAAAANRKKAAAPPPPDSQQMREISHSASGSGGSLEDLTRMDAPGRRPANRAALVNGAKVRRSPSTHETSQQQPPRESSRMLKIIRRF